MNKKNTITLPHAKIDKWQRMIEELNWSLIHSQNKKATYYKDLQESIDQNDNVMVRINRSCIKMANKVIGRLNREIGYYQYLIRKEYEKQRV